MEAHRERRIVTDQLKQAAVMALANCPFCGVALAVNNNLADLYMRRYGTIHQHPENGCYLAGNEVMPSEVSDWNRRSALQQQEAQGEATDRELHLAEQAVTGNTWRLAALRVGANKFAQMPPVGYYDWSPQEWCDWVMAATLPQDKQDAGDGKDAERYRWLRDCGEYFTYEGPAKETPWAVIGINHTDCHPCSGSRLDAAIDAAIRSAKEAEK